MWAEGTIIKWSRDDPREGFFRDSGPIKNVMSLCCGVRSKKNHSVLNNGTTCDAAFRQNSLTTCYISQQYAITYYNENMPICRKLLSGCYETGILISCAIFSHQNRTRSDSQKVKNRPNSTEPLAQPTSTHG